MLSCIALWAHKVEIDGIYYYLDEDDNTAWVTYRGGYEDDYDDEYRGSVTIPETITYYSQTYSVTSIGYGAFYDCSKLTSVTIPNSVTSIGDRAFYNTGIYNSESNWDNGVLYIDNCLINAKSDVVKGSYTIKKGTRIIGDGAFYDCSGLTSVTIGNSVTSIGYDAFYDCSGLTSVTIPNSVTSIGEYAFSGCSSLTSVTIPNSVTSIGSNVFSYCSSLNSVTIPNSVTSIGEYAFEGCSGLTSITIPNTVTSIGSGAFYNTGIYNSESNWDNGVLYIDNCLIEAMSDVVKGSYTIKKGTRIIGPSAFEFCSGLTSVTIPNSVTSIGPSAFEYCSGLTSVSIGESVTSIGNNAFSGCSGLTSVTIPNSVTSIGYNAFYKCTGLTSVIWNAKNYKDIEVYDETPFYNICSSITSFTFGNEVEHIPAYLCYDMENLKEVTIGNSVTSIDEYAFSGCDKLIKVTTYPTTAPNAYESSFEHYNAYLYVPCDVYEDYDLDDVFGSFKYIKCIAAEEVDAPDKVEIEVDEDNNAIVIWPSTDGAKKYELEISKDGEVFCTLLFNENGQLTSIDFGNRSASVGFQFTVTGLDSASKYAYSMVAMDKKGKELQSYKGTFTTNGYVPGPSEEDEPTSITETLADANITVSGGTISAEADFSIYNTIGQDVTAFNGSLQPGVYLVSIENNIVKVMVH
ncbi:MAG: leucine-rich repeat domain-containing protein [Paludibacteraceae bacterium]|nr:leucine-rich repeat domain-containing protein [Paludibacteraceae bacterium]